MDIIAEQLYHKWQISRQVSDEVDYLNYLLISGAKIEITKYSLEALQKFFIGLDSLEKSRRWEWLDKNPAENLLLNGKILVDLLRKAAEEIELYKDPARFFGKYSRQVFDDDATFLNQMRSGYQMLFWMPRYTLDPSMRANIQIIITTQSQINYDHVVSLIDIENGEPYFARLEEAKTYGTLNPTGHLAQFFFNPESELLTDNFISEVRRDNNDFWIAARHYDTQLSENYGVTESDILNYFMSSADNSIPYLVFYNQIKIDQFLKGPELEITYGCEDYPSCGHDLCPPKIDGHRFCNICTCGNLLPMGTRSICETCLKGDFEDPEDDLDELEDV